MLYQWEGSTIATVYFTDYQRNRSINYNVHEMQQHITSVLQSLHWPLVKERVHFKILVLTFKAVHGPAPDYISCLISVQLPSCHVELLLKPFNIKTYKTLGERAFLLQCHLCSVLCLAKSEKKILLTDLRLY